ncbi:MAG: aconitate hydratase, partial [Desulfovibrionaceae bacterium]|nr:aconitate hydratase [Desulfovibrionaceae bacterium]
MNLTEKIISSHLLEGELTPGAEVALRIDQTLTQDATGTMAYLQLEAMGIPRVKTELSVSYVDHNTLQMGFRNADDHRYLRTVAARHGVIFSPPGTGICHQLHLECFAAPGKILIGSDSHTPTAGGIGALAFGAGGLSVALAMGGAPYVISMPKVVRVQLVGRLTGWASAKDIILYLLSKLSVKGGVGKVFEYCGPGVASLSVTDRATITNMGAELGATTSIFPSDARTREFLERMGRAHDWIELGPDPDA